MFKSVKFIGLVSYREIPALTISGVKSVTRQQASNSPEVSAELQSNSVRSPTVKSLCFAKVL